MRWAGLSRFGSSGSNLRGQLRMANFLEKSTMKKIQKQIASADSTELVTVTCGIWGDSHWGIRRHSSERIIYLCGPSVWASSPVGSDTEVGPWTTDIGQVASIVWRSL